MSRDWTPSQRTAGTPTESRRLSPSGEDADLDILAQFTGDPDSVVTAHNGEALAKLIKFVAVTSSQIGSRSVRLAESGEQAHTKQESAAEQIREFAESDEINADIEAGW